MVNSKYAKAYTEVLEIISYFPQEAYNKIPSEKINFYKQKEKPHLFAKSDSPSFCCFFLIILRFPAPALQADHPLIDAHAYPHRYSTFR